MLESLRRIVHEVSTAENLDEVLAIIVDRVKAVISADVCSIYLTDTSRQENVLMATQGLNPDSVHRVRLKFDRGLIGQVCTRAEPINIDNAPDHPNYVYFKETGEENYFGFLGVPILHHRKVMGVIVVQQRERRSYDENDVTLLVTLAAQLAGVIAHAQASGALDQLTSNGLPKDLPFRGLPGAPGVGIGTGVVIYPAADLEAVPDRFTEDTKGEIAVLLAAIDATGKEIEELKQRVSHLPSENQLLFDAYSMMLRSESFIKNTTDRITQQHVWASTALRDSIRQQVQAFAAMDDDYLSARAEDIKDLGRRILVNIQSKSRGPRHYPERAILVGEEITATALMEVPPGKLAGVVSVKGSSTSHTAIIARAMGIPAIMGATDVPVHRLEACNIVVDGYQGLAYVDPSPTVLLEYARLKMEEYELSSELAELKGLPAITPDGFRIPLYVNLGLLAEVSSTQDGDAEGIGLYRTEFPFMIRDRFPGEDEQTHIYLQALKAFSPRPVTLRTLDIGGDKALNYFPINEENPFLGWRGIRVSLDHPDIFLTQIRAMLRAAEGTDNLHILLPMITNISEIDESLKYIARAREELIAAGHKAIAMPKIGAMIEVPSAVYQATAIAKRVDFISIGTNDLTQYLLAVDRNNGNVANLYDCLHPAVLNAIYTVTKSANMQKVPVSVCGEMAGDPAATILFVGMGMDTLSMSMMALPRVKWVIRSVTYKRAQELLARALVMDDAQSIRALMHEELDRLGLGALIRPGR